MLERSSRRSHSLSIVGVLVFAGLLAPASPRADDSNFRPYLIGSRAAGMGGAFTALADDGSGPYYNPAGIGFIRRSQLSLSGSVYGAVSGSIADAVGPGNAFSYSNLQTLPTATAGVFQVGGTDPEHQSVLALSVYVPDAFLMDGRDTSALRPGTAPTALSSTSYMLTSQSSTVWGGLTYARRWGRVSIGVSGFVLFETSLNQFDLTRLDPATPDLPTASCGSIYCTNNYQTVSSRVETTTFGVVGALGARWDATDQLRFGLSVYSPEVGFGTRRAFARMAQSIATGATTGLSIVGLMNEENLHASPTLPLRIQGGVAWTSGRFTVSADAQYLAPREVVDDADRAADGLERRVVRNAVLNGSVGMEYVIADRFPLRWGLFTDFAASNGPVAVAPDAYDPNTTNSGKIDRYGGTLSIGFRTEHTATDLGVMVSGGKGKDLVPSNLEFRGYNPADSSQLFTYIFLGTAYEF